MGPADIRAIARIDPDLAVEQLVRLPVRELYLTRGWFLPHLLEARREQVNRRLLEHMRAASDPWEVASAYSGSVDDFDPDALEFLLDEFGAMLQRLAENPPPPSAIST